MIKDIDHDGLKKYVRNFGMEVVLVDLCGIIKKANADCDDYLTQLYEDVSLALSNYRERHNQIGRQERTAVLIGETRRLLAGLHDDDITARRSLENMLQQLTQEMQKNGEYKEKHIPPATMADAVKAQEDTTAPEWISLRFEVTASEDGEVKE